MKIKNKPYSLGIFLLLVIVFSLLISPFTSNLTTTIYAHPSMQKVYDFANLFTQEEIEKLEAISLEQGEVGKVDIVFITTNSLDDKTRKSYLEDFYDEHGFGYDKEYGDTALILLNMDPDDRGVEIQGYGMAEHYVHNDRIEHILDDIVPLLSDGDYFDAMEEFAHQVAYYMNQDKGVNTNPIYGDETSGNYYGEASYDGPSDYYGQENFLDSIIFRLIISLIIGTVAVIIMAYNSSGKTSTTSRTYLDHENSRVVAHHDLYVRTHTTRVRKPQQNTNSGGRSSGGGGISSGGHSHSGGGRSF